jgi:hypothetical protein
VGHDRIGTDESIISCGNDNESWAEALMSGPLVVELPAPERHLDDFEKRDGQEAFEYTAKCFGNNNENEMRTAQD